MGLSERKNKQRIGVDPRNLTWSNDTSRFSYKHLSNLGWSSSSGIGGSSLEGNPNHIAVVRKFDNGGIGIARARKEGDDQAAGAGPAGRDFESVLKRLAGSGSPSGASTPTEVVGTPTEEAVERKRAKIASRQRHLYSKRLASSSPAALAEILGVPISSLPASPAPVDPSPSTHETASLSPAPVPESESEPQRTAEETISTSTLSVHDYFKQKMREKLKARQGANGVVPEPEVTTLKGTDTWEGSRTTFDEKIEDVVVDEKAARRVRKEAKRLKKLEKEAAATTESESRIDEGDGAASKEKKRKKRKAADDADGDSATAGKEGKEAGKAKKRPKKVKAEH